MTHGALVRPTVPPAGLSRRQLLYGAMGGAAALLFAPSSLPTAVAAPAKKHQHTVVIDAPTDGTDATATILRQINRAPDGSIIRFPVGRSQGRYRVDGTLRLINRKRLVIVGPSATDPATIWTDLTGQQAGHVGRDGISSRPHWSLTGCEDIALCYLRVEGPNNVRGADGYPYLIASQEPEHAFQFRYCNEILVDRCSSESVYGDGFYIGPASGTPTTNIAILQGRVQSQGRHGAGVVNAAGVLIEGLVVTNGGTSGVDMEPNAPSAAVSDLEISGGQFDVRRVAFSALGSRAVSGVYIHDATVTHALVSWPMICVAPGDGGTCSDWRIESNQQTFVSRPHCGVSLTRVSNATITGNTLALGGDNEDLTGVNFMDCDGSLVMSDNNFGAAKTPYQVSGSTTTVSE
jgi:hypothetical protein